MMLRAVVAPPDDEGFAQPRLISLGSQEGVVLTMDEVVEVDVPAVPPMHDVMPVNPQMWAEMGWPGLGRTGTRPPRRRRRCRPRETRRTDCYVTLNFPLLVAVPARVLTET